MNNIEEEKEKTNTKPWNYTKIESKNIHGTVDRNDDLPGHFGKTDLSLYYYDIQENKNEIPDKFKAPHWTSVTRTDLLNKKYDAINQQKIEGGEIKNEKNNKIKKFDIQLWSWMVGGWVGEYIY
jgi:hypothetical protein